MRGWFDAFRTDGGPTLYAYSNRTSVTGDVPTITICLVFLTIYVAFVIIFPGIRKEKFSTFCTVTLSLLTGIIICVCNNGSEWEVSSGTIISSYRAFSPTKIKADLGVSIGLDHANITLKVIPTDNRSLDIDYNERFHWITPTDMKHHYQDALRRGLPYPILTAAEYLTVDREGLAWGRDYRNAGYYTSIMLWSAFACWLLANILLVNVPRYGAYLLMLTGAMMVSAAIIYSSLKPQTPLMMRFEDTIITFKLGWCFYMTLLVGLLVGISGLVISIVDWVYPHKFSTILEIDFDTPYDRHIIIEDSHDTRKKRFKIPRLEEPLNVGRAVGSRLLRRLSKRGPVKETVDAEVVETNPGLDNPGFEMELPPQPKSPWKSSLMIRTDSKKSNKSVVFKNSLKAPAIFEVDMPNGEDKSSQSLKRTESKPGASEVHKIQVNGEGEVYPLPELPHMKRQDSSQSYASSSSSFGLGMLTRGLSVRKISDENNHQPVTRNNSGNIIVFHRTDSRGQLQRLSGEVVEIQTDDSVPDW